MAQSVAAGGAASVLPIAIGAGAAVGTAVGVGYAGWKTIRYFTAKGYGEKAP